LIVVNASFCFTQIVFSLRHDIAFKLFRAMLQEITPDRLEIFCG